MVLNDHLPAKSALCRVCYAPTYEATVEGFKVQTTRIPLTLDGQIHALRNGDTLYQLEIPRSGNKLDVHHYSRERLRAATNPIVVPQHRCGWATPAEHIDTEALYKLGAFHNPPPPAQLFEPPF